MDIADKLVKAKEEELRRQEEYKKELEDMKLLFRQAFGSNNGIKIAKFLMRESGIYRLNKPLESQQMAFDRGKEYMYLIIKAMLTKEQIAEIESK